MKLLKKLSGAVLSMVISIMTTSQAFAGRLVMQTKYGSAPMAQDLYGPSPNFNTIAEDRSILEILVGYGWKIIIPVAIIFCGAIIFFAGFMMGKKKKKYDK